MIKILKLTQALACVTAVVGMSIVTATSNAQTFGGLGDQTNVDAQLDRIEVITGSSRRLKFDYKIPEILIENPEVIKATPIGPQEILVSGLRPGLSTMTVSDPSKNLQTITVHVTADTRKLKAALEKFFPDSNVGVDALQTGVVLSGNVARADHINNIMAIARDYFPTTVINQMQVDGSQLVAIKVKVYEVSRSKLRKLGIDWAIQGDDYTIASSISGLLQQVGIGTRTVAGSGQTLTFGVIGTQSDFTAFIEALEQNNLARLLDQPTLTAQHGRPAEFLSGGEIPIAVASGLGTNSIEFRAFGTKLDVVPLIHGQGEVTLEIRAEVSEVAPELAGDTGVPGFRVRRVNTGVRMKAGHTLALAGDYKESASAVQRGIPKLMDSSIWGPLFRQNQDNTTETELVFLITPQFINEVDPTMVPKYGPGQLTELPSRHELYCNGYQEVPRCNDDCPTQDRFDNPAAANYPAYQQSLMNMNQKNGQPVQGNFQQSGYSTDQGTTGSFLWPEGNGK